ncbi:hypothetical protein ADUPG1_007244, partial [Aduncisulcus paluster]
DVRGKDILDDIRLFILDALYGLIGMRPDHQFLACRCPLYPPCPYCPPAERFCPDEPICPDPVCGDCPCPLMPDCPVGRCQDICPEPPIQPECPPKPVCQTSSKCPPAPVCPSEPSCDLPTCDFSCPSCSESFVKIEEESEDCKPEISSPCDHGCEFVWQREFDYFDDCEYYMMDPKWKFNWPSQYDGKKEHKWSDHKCVKKPWKKYHAGKEADKKEKYEHNDAIGEDAILE